MTRGRNAEILTTLTGHPCYIYPTMRDCYKNVAWNDHSEQIDSIARYERGRSFDYRDARLTWKSRKLSKGIVGNSTGDARWRLPRNQKPPLVIRYPLQMFRQDFRQESLLRCRDSQRELQRRE